MDASGKILYYPIMPGNVGQATIEDSKLRNIPSYELYGDLLAGNLADPVHHETIEERSRRHDWTIRLHRHGRLAQIFLFHSPGVRFQIGDVQHTSTDGMILVVPPGVVHGFWFSEDVVGDVLSIRLEDVSEELRLQFSGFENTTHTILDRSETSHFSKVNSLFQQLGEAYQSISPTRAEILIATVKLITLYIQSDRQARTSLNSNTAEFPRGRQDILAELFCNCVEKSFRRKWSVNDYARDAGTSASHLSRVCRTVLGASPNELVRQRRVLEAKRLLEYSALSMSEIAYRCGFRDTAYFSRTFKKLTGLSPLDYRREHGR
ncbi:MAG: helix-turn-helix domain-containing protein [Pseudomonadota bacterium]